MHFIKILFRFGPLSSNLSKHLLIWSWNTRRAFYPSRGQHQRDVILEFSFDPCIKETENEWEILWNRWLTSLQAAQCTLKKSSKTSSFFLQLTECMKMCPNIFVSHTITFGRPFPQIVNIFVFSYKAVSNIFSQTHLTLVLHRQLATGWKMWKVKSPDTFSLYTLLQSASDLDLCLRARIEGCGYRKWKIRNKSLWDWKFIKCAALRVTFSGETKTQKSFFEKVQFSSTIEHPGPEFSGSRIRKYGYPSDLLC